MQPKQKIIQNPKSKSNKATSKQEYHTATIRARTVVKQQKAAMMTTNIKNISATITTLNKDNNKEEKQHKQWTHEKETTLNQYNKPNKSKTTSQQKGKA